MGGEIYRKSRSPPSINEAKEELMKSAASSEGGEKENGPRTLPQLIGREKFSSLIRYTGIYVSVLIQSYICFCLRSGKY